MQIECQEKRGEEKEKKEKGDYGNEIKSRWGRKEKPDVGKKRGRKRERKELQEIIRKIIGRKEKEGERRGS